MWCRDWCFGKVSLDGRDTHGTRDTNWFVVLTALFCVQLLFGFDDTSD